MGPQLSTGSKSRSTGEGPLLSEKENSTIPFFKVVVNGKEITEEALGAIESVTFEDEINTSRIFTMKLSSFDFDDGSFRFIDLDDFCLGSETKLYMGMDSSTLMMTGEIVSIEPHFGEDKSTVEIHSYDQLHRLGFGKKQRTFSNKSDSELATMVAGDWNLSSSAEDTKIKYQHIWQYNQSDFEFLLERAKRIRYEFFVENKTLFFRPSQENSSPSLALEYRVDIAEFSVRLRTLYMGSEFHVKGWDFIKKEPILAIAREDDEISDMAAGETGAKITKSAFGSGLSAVSSAALDEKIENSLDAKKLAVAQYNSQLVDAVTGEGKCAGIPELRAGKTIELKGIGRFSGIYYVTSTTHVIDNEGYNVFFRVRRVGV
ncbi:phage late control D family protein [Methanosarcina sp.]|uniref:phage late control D family protein n=1 Tax=Methanosarcina sp. TaxID=2213 RepID=UPI003C758A99